MNKSAAPEPSFVLSSANVGATPSQPAVSSPAQQDVAKNLDESNDFSDGEDMTIAIRAPPATNTMFDGYVNGQQQPPADRDSIDDDELVVRAPPAVRLSVQPARTRLSETRMSIEPLQRVRPSKRRSGAAMQTQKWAQERTQIPAVAQEWQSLAVERSVPVENDLAEQIRLIEAQLAGLSEEAPAFIPAAPIAPVAPVAPVASAAPAAPAAPAASVAPAAPAAPAAPEPTAVVMPAKRTSGQIERNHSVGAAATDARPAQTPAAPDGEDMGGFDGFGQVIIPHHETFSTTIQPP
jgi:hypothetical protein